jgi:peptidyl-tRNA hydrolase, PTH1 family
MQISMAVKLIIGLGNPDNKHQNTYHSVGFLFIDYLTKNPRNSQFSRLRRGFSGQEIPNCQLLKSSVYMNESGFFAAKMLKKTGLKPEELLAVHDDSDIELGKFKLSFARGSAGHKGAASIIQVLKTNKFWRLRIGIRQPAPPARAGEPRPVRPGGKAGNFVLKKISSPNQKILRETFENISGKIQELLA